MISCDDDGGSINPPDSIVGNYYYKHFNKREAKQASGGIAGDKVESMSLTYHFIDNHNFEVDGYVETYSGGKSVDIYGSYDYNNKTGRIILKYDRSYMGMDRDKGVVGENYLRVGQWKFREK